MCDFSSPTADGQYNRESDLTDLSILTDPLDTTLFPGVSSNVLVHGGFRDEHAQTALTILTEVKRLMALHATAKLALVGHSLGGALAELDSLFFALNLPTAVITTRTFGKPRAL